MTFHEKPETYEETLENLTEENWHRERELIEKKLAEAEAEAERLREALSDLLVHVPNGTPSDPAKHRAYQALASRPGEETT